MQYPRDAESKFGYRRVEFGAIRRNHLITAAHGSHRRFDGRTTRVFVGCARFQSGLLAYHAVATDLLNVFIRVCDDPVAADEPGRDRAIVGYRDGVGKHIARLIFV